MTSRFKLLLATTWLVCRRAKLPRDLRNKIVRLIACNVFDWESSQLRWQRQVMLTKTLRYYESNALDRQRYRVLGAIVIHVEECPPHPFPLGADVGLQLTKLSARRHYYAPINWFWMRIRE